MTDQPTSTWEPKVGGIVTTEDEYEALPSGSIVAEDVHHGKDVLTLDPFVKVRQYWHSGDGIGCKSSYSEIAGIPRRILRVGWEL